jgi:hypothetical protein
MVIDDWIDWVCVPVSHGLLRHLVHDRIFLWYSNNNKMAASAFPWAYSWEFNPSLVSYSAFPENLSDGEHKEPLQWPGQQHQQLGQPSDRAAHCQPKLADAGSATNSPTSAAQPVDATTVAVGTATTTLI